MAMTATATGGLKLNSCSRRARATKKVMGSTKFTIQYPNRSNPTNSTRLRESFSVQAREAEEEDKEKLEAFTSKEDVGYLVKLVAGSFVGAAVVKYGSILVPVITRPNIFVALVIISTPVIIALSLLIKQSSAERQG